MIDKMQDSQVNVSGGGFGQGPGGFGGPPPGGFGGPPPGGFGGPPPGGFGGPPPGVPPYGPPPAPPYGGPPGGFGGPGGAAPPDALQKKVELWFILSIVSLFCGCGLLGIIPIVLANNAKDALRRGDFAKAEKDIGTAKLLCILGYVLIASALLFYVIYFVFVVGVVALSS